MRERGCTPSPCDGLWHTKGWKETGLPTPTLSGQRTANYTDPIEKDYLREASLASLARETTEAKSQNIKEQIRRHVKAERRYRPPPSGGTPLSNMVAERLVPASSLSGCRWVPWLWLVGSLHPHHCRSQPPPLLLSWSHPSRRYFPYLSICCDP